MNRHDRRAANTNDPTASEIERRNGVVLEWGDFRIMVHRQDMDRTRERVGRMSQEARAGMAKVVTHALMDNGEKIKVYGFVKELTDMFYQDIMIWNVLKESGVVQ